MYVPCLRVLSRARRRPIAVAALLCVLLGGGPVMALGQRTEQAIKKVTSYLDKIVINEAWEKGVVKAEEASEFKSHKREVQTWVFKYCRSYLGGIVGSDARDPRVVALKKRYERYAAYAKALSEAKVEPASGAGQPQAPGNKPRSGAAAVTLSSRTRSFLSDGVKRLDQFDLSAAWSKGEVPDSDVRAAQSALRDNQKRLRNAASYLNRITGRDRLHPEVEDAFSRIEKYRAACVSLAAALKGRKPTGAAPAEGGARPPQAAPELSPKEEAKAIAAIELKAGEVPPYEKAYVPIAPGSPTKRWKTFQGAEHMHRLVSELAQRVSRECLCDNPQLERSVADVARRLGAYKGPERFAWLALLGRVLRPRIAAAQQGVPGVGTHEQIAARMAASMTAMKAVPKGPALTAAEIDAYVAATVGYRERAAKDHAFAIKLEGDVCYDGRGSKAREHDFWRKRTSASEVAKRCAAAQAKLLPRFPAEASFHKIMKRLSKARAVPVGEDYLTELDLARDCANLYKVLSEERPLLALIPHWRPALEAGLAARLERVAVQRPARLEAAAKWTREFLLRARLPAPSGDAAAQALVTKYASADAVAISEVVAAEQERSEQFHKEGKLWERRWTEAFEQVELYWVEAPKAGREPLYEGIPKLGPVGTLFTATLRKYSKGRGVKLGVWLLEDMDGVGAWLVENK